MLPSELMDSPVGVSCAPFMLMKRDSLALGEPLGPTVGSDIHVSRSVDLTPGCGSTEVESKLSGAESTMLGALLSAVVAGRSIPPAKLCICENRLFWLIFANSASVNPCRKSTFSPETIDSDATRNGGPLVASEMNEGPFGEVASYCG